MLVATAGHIDHGKTALVRALTGIDTDRLEEEKQRGVSIALGFAHLPAGDGGRIDLIDMPGHERFVRTMIAGATGIDAVLVVVAANEGIRPQSREHLAIARLLGLNRAVVAISKADLATADEIAQVSAETRALLADAGFAAEAPVPTSVRDNRGIAALQAGLAQLAAGPRRASGEGGVAFLPIDRAFVIAGHGTVVTGTLRGAAVHPGDVLDLLPAARPVRVRAVQVRGLPVAAGEPGQRVALNLRDVAAADLARGMVLAQPGTLDLSPWLTLAIEPVPGAPPLKNGLRLRALFGTAEVDARLRLLDRDVLEAGEHGLAQLHCAEAVALPAGEHAILRLPSPVGTVAGGRVLDPNARRLRRNDPAVLRRLAGLRDLAAADVVAAEVAGERPTTVARLARLLARSEAAISGLLAPLPVLVTRRGAILRRSELDRLVAAIPALLAGAPLGLSRKHLLAALPGSGAVLIDESMAALAQVGLVVRRGGQFAIPRPGEDATRQQGEEAMADEIAATLRRSGLTPPNPAAIVVDASTRRAVDRLLRAGTIVRAVDAAKQREMLFHREAIAEARRRLEPLLAGSEGLLVSEISAALGLTRKFTMPLLAHLDAVRFTRRDGDRRFRHGLASREPVETSAGRDR